MGYILKCHSIPTRVSPRAEDDSILEFHLTQDVVLTAASSDGSGCADLGHDVTSSSSPQDFLRGRRGAVDGILDQRSGGRYPFRDAVVSKQPPPRHPPTRTVHPPRFLRAAVTAVGEVASRLAAAAAATAHRYNSRSNNSNPLDNTSLSSSSSNNCSCCGSVVVTELLKRLKRKTVAGGDVTKT
jgi:hypothetical protein